MKRGYKTVTEVSLLKEKKYLLNLCLSGRIQYSLYQCFHIKQLKKIINNQDINREFFHQALLALYQCQDFESLEEHLIMMNKYFHYPKYEKIKKQLFQKICKTKITIQEYCVLRHLVHFESISFEYFIQELHVYYGVDNLECAKICLLEDHSHLAYEYLKQLDDCQNENILDLLNTNDYLLLKNYYQQKKKGYLLLPTH